ncbi:MAG: segregation/condensation protein A, partial [Actinobacteria bacterium]|nr:segregation/condensation protein A [Actinomycetota bacterium]
MITHNKFSGTIETLLTLIQKREVDIYEIKLATIIGDFLSYIREKKDISLDVISNFLYMASILLEIKSKSIIPTGKNLE